MSKYDTTIAQIKEMINRQEYVDAMEEIEDLSFKQIPSISDMYLFADIFSKAEKLDVAKDLYYTAYRRTNSKPALYKLLMLVIRMGDLSEAKELFKTFQLKDGNTLDTYEFRYRIAKACGEPRQNLIAILEELKENEFTEEWGMQLAILYEMEGMRDECIRTCEDIEIWFGSGNIVDKATALKEKCMSPEWVKPERMEIPEPEEPEIDYMSPEFAYAPITTTEIGTYEEAVSKVLGENAKIEPETDVVDDISSGIKAAMDAEDGVFSTVDTNIDTSVVDSSMAAKGKRAVADAEQGRVAASAGGVVEEELKDDFDSAAQEYEDQKDNYEEAPKTEKKSIFKKFVNYFKIDFDDYEDNPENDDDEYYDEYADEEESEDMIAEGKTTEESADSEVVEPVENEKAINKAGAGKKENDATAKENEKGNEDEKESKDEKENKVIDKAVAEVKENKDTKKTEVGKEENIVMQKADSDKKENKAAEKAEADNDMELDVADYKPEIANSIDSIMKKEKNNKKKAVSSQKKAKENVTVTSNAGVKRHDTMPIESLEDQLNEVNEKKETLSLDDTLSLEISKIKKAAGEQEAVQKLEPEPMDSFGGENSYISLKNAINKLHSEKGIINFALTGAGGGMPLAVAKKLFKELKKINYSPAANLGKISAAKLDDIKLGEWSEKFMGGCMYISDVGELSESSANNIVKMIRTHKKDIVVILEGNIEDLNTLFENHPDLAKVITYKVMLKM